MSYKTISKRLREWAERGEECSESPISIAEDDLGLLGDDIIREADLLRVIAEEADADMREGNNASARHIMTNWAEYNDMPMLEHETIGEWFNRWFIPRPRFEDGEPVQDSDIEEIGCLATCCVYTDGSWDFEPDKYEDETNPKPWDHQSGTMSDRIKRPDTKVLDADGVRICNGDTVWDVDSGEKLTVQEFANSECGLVQCCNDDGECEDHDAHNLTHREPDSLDKLRDDMLKHVNLRCFADRLTALIERGV